MEREEERGERGRGKMGGGKGEKEMGRTIACIILISRNIEQLNYKYYYIIITSLVRHTCRYLEHSILFMYTCTCGHRLTDSQTQKD